MTISDRRRVAGLPAKATPVKINISRATPVSSKATPTKSSGGMSVSQRRSIYSK